MFVFGLLSLLESKFFMKFVEGEMCVLKKLKYKVVPVLYLLLVP
jgi:hypothetical protein